MQQGSNSDSAGGIAQSSGHDLQVRGPDAPGALICLAARWAEMYAPQEGDDERSVRERFRTAHDYLDAVIHGIEPPRP